MKFVRICLLPLAFLCVGLIRLLWGFGVRVRIGEFFSSRLGHLAGNTECYLCERDDSSVKYFDLWTHAGEISNKFLAKMLGRVMWIDPTRFVKLVALCNAMFEGWQKHIAQSTQLDRDIYNLFEKYPPHLSFTKSEEQAGEAGLRRLGIPLGAKWVCLIVRDSAYLPHLAYHSFRDADVETYALTAKNLKDRGYYVLRMGAKVNKSINSPYIIDFSKQYEDFLSVYLGAKCSFCISTGCGFDAIPYIFRRPIVYTNYVPFEYFFTFAQKSLAIWKHHEKAGKKMTLEEIYKSKAGQFMQAREFTEEGITLIDNTSEEIKDVVMEMADQVDFKFSTTDQSEFWKSYPRSISPYNQQPLHGEIRMRIGSEFLKGYQ